MVVRVLDSRLEERLIAQRQATGADRYDEVWDGVYVMSPLANNEHQKLATKLAAIFEDLLGNRDDVWSLAGANVSDQEVDWTRNFRCPDVVVVLPGSRAENRNTHWYGGPDFLVEIASEGDATYEKFDFYGRIGVREALIVDRDPWSLELHRLHQAGAMTLVGRVDLSSGSAMVSEVLDAEFRLVERAARPSIRVLHRLTGRTWQT
jgi:Uma2 family endonuclease